MLSEIKPALRLLLILTVLTGVIYPLAITGVAQVIFPRQAQGSFVTVDGKMVGSSLIGQRFARPDYFHSRPSAAGDKGYDASQSHATNQGPTNKGLIAAITARAKRCQADYGGENAPPVPSDLVTSSGSGLDPDLSPAAARYQVPRIARVRGLDIDRVYQLVTQMVEKRDFGLFGEDRINVLTLNLALDRLSRQAAEVR